MSTPVRWLAAATTILLLFACGSSPPVRYYSLDAMHQNADSAPEGTPLLSLGPLRFPEYLSRTQIVTRGSGSEMIVDDFNRWAEPLDQAVHRALAADVDSQVENVVVIAFPSSSLTEFDYRLVGSVNRFDVDLNREAQLSVQWGIADADGNALVEPRRSHFTATANSSSKSDLAGALSDTIAQFSREIAAEIEASLPAETD